MQQPMARVVKLEYRDMNPKMKMDASAFIVYLRGPDGDIHEHPLKNTAWEIDNPTLQFMALNNFRPSDLGGTSANVEEWNWLLPVAPHDGGYLLAENVLEGGEKALKNAEWFTPSEKSNDSDGDDSGPHGGGGGGSNTGNRGGVNHEEKDNVTTELTPEDDTGVEVTVS